MKILAIFLITIAGLLSVSSVSPDETKRTPDQLINTKKIVAELQKELDNVLQRYEDKLDNQLEKYEGKMDDQIGRLDGQVSDIEQRLDGKLSGLEKKLDDQISKAEGRLDQTFDKVDEELGDVKSALLGTVGTIAWRFTIVDIVTAIFATFITAFLTAYLAAKKIQVEKFRKEMEAVVADVKKGIEEVKR